jgi:hypothetical protein
MMPQRISRKIQAILAAVGGAGAVGSIVGLPRGTQALLAQGATLPLILAAVAVICSPALFIGTALLGNKASVSQIASAIGQGTMAAGHALLGFVPVALFLTATRPASSGPAIAVFGLIAIAVVAGLLRTWHALAAGCEYRKRLAPYFVCWSGASLTLGGLLLFHSIRLGGVL